MGNMACHSSREQDINNGVKTQPSYCYKLKWKNTFMCYKEQTHTMSSAAVGNTSA